MPLHKVGGEGTSPYQACSSLFRLPRLYDHGIRISNFQINGPSSPAGKDNYPLEGRHASLPARWTPVTLLGAMYTVKDLARRFGLHPKRVRERLAALGPVIEPHMIEGKQNAKLLTDAGLALFDRLRQLEQEGYTVQAAVQKLREELSDRGKTAGHQPSNEGVNDSPDAKDELIKALKAQVEDLRAERDRLLAIIENQTEQLRALMPAGKDQRSGKMNRWQALKVLILGRRT